MKNVLSSAFNAVYSGPADEAAPMSTEERDRVTDGVLLALGVK